MRIEFEFDKNRVEAMGYTMPRVVATLKKAFAERNLRCISENGVIAFSDAGSEHDFASIWILITRLINSSWFLKCATACNFFDGTKVNGKEAREDVLAQAYKLKR